MTLPGLVRLSLAITAPFNVLAGIAFAWPASVIGQFNGMPPTSNPFYGWMAGGVIAIFGFAYATMAWSGVFSRGLLAVGAAGKTFAVIISWIAASTALLPTSTAVFMTGDLIFASLWVWYLLQTKQD